MKAATHIDYKALYTQSLQRMGEQEKLIALLGDDVTKSIQEQQRLSQAVNSMQKTILQKEALIEAGKIVIASQERTIQSQSEKIIQQERVITSLDQLVLQQQQELLQNKMDLSTLPLLKHELRLLRELIHGRRSEKHYPSADTTEQNAKAGEQLSFNLEVDAVAIRCIKNTKLIPEHIRLTTEIIEKKPHPGRHEWPEGLREELIDVYPAEIPAGAILLRYVDTRQLACTDMEFYLKVNRRYI